MIIRPERERYNPEKSLGPKLFFIENRVFRRSDISLVNSRGLRIECSYFEPIGRMYKKLPVVIYCHGNSGSRLDSFETIEFLLP